MKIFVTGGTGFLGTEVVQRLVQSGHQVLVLARSAASVRTAGAEAVVGEIGNISSWEEQLRGVDACVHLIGILRENRSQGVTFEKMHYQATVDLVRACGKMGVKRFVYVSANGVEKGLSMPYMRSKAMAEQAVRSSNLEWTLLRPSVVYGGEPGRQNFVDMLKANLDRAAYFPYPGDGNYRMAPISAREVAWSIVRCVADRETIGKYYHLCGSETYTYKALLMLLNQAGNYRCGLFSLPLWLMSQATGLLSAIPAFPVTPDMLKMLAAGNDCPSGAPTQKDLGVLALSFKDWLTTGVLPDFPLVPSLPRPAEESAPVTQHLQGGAVTRDLTTDDLDAALNTRPLNAEDSPL